VHLDPRSNPGKITAAHGVLGVSLWWVGDLAAAEAEFQVALAHVGYDLTIHAAFQSGSLARGTLALVRWLRGYADQAVGFAEQTIDDCITIRHPLTSCGAHVWLARISLWAGDWQRAEDNIDKVLTLARRNGFATHQQMGLGLRAELMTRGGDAASGIAGLKEALPALSAHRYTVQNSMFSCALAEGLATLGEVDSALQTIGEAIDEVENRGDLIMMPELMRIRGELLAEQPDPDLKGAESCLRRSLALAHSNGALSWELRSASSLARLLFARGEPQQAAQMLTPIYKSFTEGFATVDLQMAKRIITQINSSH
jgi:ATP/maltotriose-dependent transcriptional regulator MalT